MQKFTWKNIICRYDLPQAIVTDNGRQFTEKGCEEFLKQLGIRHLNSSMESPNQWASRSHKQSHPCRVTQKTVEGSHGAVGRRAPEHAWGDHCTPQFTMQETPFKLTYNTEAMILVEIGEPSLRRGMFNMTNNSESLAVELDLAEEVRSEARVHEEACKKRVTWKYNSKLRKRNFKTNDMVWRLRGDSRKDNLEVKLTLNWEWSFRVVE